MSEVNYYAGPLVQAAYLESKDTEGTRFQRETWNLGVAIDKAVEGLNMDGTFGAADLDAIKRTDGWSEGQKLALEVLRDGAKDGQRLNGADVAQAHEVARAAHWADDPRFVSNPKIDGRLDADGPAKLAERTTLTDTLVEKQVAAIRDFDGEFTFDLAKSIFLAR